MISCPDTWKAKEAQSGSAHGLPRYTDAGRGQMWHSEKKPDLNDGVSCSLFVSFENHCLGIFIAIVLNLCFLVTIQ